MKIQTYFLISCFLWSYTWVEAQENLVPNPGFEEVVSCVENEFAFIDKAQYWFWLNSPAFLFHECLGQAGADEQIEDLGPQAPRSGVGMAGEVVGAASGNYTDSRYTCVELIRPLVQDSLYVVSYYVNYGDSADIACSNCIDAFFFEDLHPDSIFFPSFPPQGVSMIQNPRDRILKDKTGWMQICDTLRATGKEHFLVIGSTVEYNDLILEFTGGRGELIWYYVDDVSIYKIPGGSQSKVQRYAGCETDLPLRLKGRPDFLHYHWSTGDTSAILEVWTPGIYTLTYDYGCGSLTDTFVVEIETLAPPIDLGSDRLSCESDQFVATIIDAGPDQARYIWSTGDTTSQIIATAPRTYTVKADYIYCPDRSDSIQLFPCPPRLDFIIEFPNVFTPNGDNRNDTWTGQYENIQFQRLEVFDRWGRKVFQTAQEGRAWDGRHNGENLPEGVYYYRLSFLRPVTNVMDQAKGTILLLR
ncbi:MAG: gliding motility-associated C-terminal domain-containing protein [Bacteroidota bacterium]